MTALAPFLLGVEAYLKHTAREGGHLHGARGVLGPGGWVTHLTALGEVQAGLPFEIIGAISLVTI